MKSRQSSFNFHSGNEERHHYWYVRELARPAGATTQWLRFRFQSKGMVAHSPASHFAVAVHAQIGIDSEGLPISLSGRGLTLGDTSLATAAAENEFALQPGFGGARGAQIESFWPGGNFLYRETALLPEGIQDDRWYTIELSCDDTLCIRLTIEPESGDREAARVKDRDSHPVIANACGAFIALSRGPGESGEWAAEFRDIECGWI